MPPCHVQTIALPLGADMRLWTRISQYARYRSSTNRGRFENVTGQRPCAGGRALVIGAETGVAGALPRTAVAVARQVGISVLRGSHHDRGRRLRTLRDDVHHDHGDVVRAATLVRRLDERTHRGV